MITCPITSSISNISTSRSSTDSVTPHHHELRLRAVSQPLLVTVDQAFLNNLFIYLIFNISLHPSSLLFVHCLLNLIYRSLRACITRISQLYHTEEGSRVETFMAINIHMLYMLNKRSINQQ